MVRTPHAIMTARPSFSRCLLLVCSLVLLAFAPEPARAQIHDGVQLVTADLLADTSAVTPGKPFTVGLRLRMQPHWHTYYLYSGDAGLPTKDRLATAPGFQGRTAPVAGARDHRQPRATSSTTVTTTRSCC